MIFFITICINKNLCKSKVTKTVLYQIAIELGNNDPHKNCKENVSKKILFFLYISEKIGFEVMELL